MAQVEKTEEDLNRKAQLLAAIRNKNKKEALKLLAEGVGVDHQDATGSYPIHYAADNGYDDVIEVLLEKGAKVTDWNKNGRTALHTAALRGHERAIVTLVAGGAVVGTVDRHGCLALEYALKQKHVTAVKLLCQFGSEPLLQDWKWISAPDLKKKKVEYEMALILQRKTRLLPGYRHKGIIFDVTKVTPEMGPALHLEKTGIEVKITEDQVPYYLYLCKTEEAYGTPPPLQPDEEAFGHLLECQIWGPRVQTITLTVTVDRVLRKNEEIVLRPATLKGVVDDVETPEEGKVTKITMTVPLQPTGITEFATASREKTQVFKISKEAVVLKPEGEPEAEIDIPAGAFASGDLEVKFVDTTEAMRELERDNQDRGEESEDDPILLTNILDISTTDGQKPQKDIQMKLPINAKNKTKDVVVLVTSNPDPNLEEWDWEVLPAEIDGDGKAVFTVKHFSSHIVIERAKYEANPEGVKERIKNIRTRKVDFLVALKDPEVDETKAEMTIICGTQKRIENMGKTEYKNYKCFYAGKSNKNTLPLVLEGQIFKFFIRDDVKEHSDDDNMKLIFKGDNTESSRALEVVGTCPDKQELSGTVEIFKKAKSSTADDDNKGTDEKADVGFFCRFCSCCRSSKVTPKTTEDEGANTSTQQPMCIIPFNIALTKREPERKEDKDSLPESDLKEDKDSFPGLPTVTWKKLVNAVAELSADEGKQIGFQLGLNGDQMEQIVQDTMDDKDLASNVVRKWCLLKNTNNMGSKLKHAFEAIGRQDLIKHIRQ